MNSISELIDSLYKDFIDLKERILTMDLADDTDKSLIASETLGTDNIVLSISTYDFTTEYIELYVDIISLYNLGYTSFETNIKFDNIDFSVFILSLNEDKLLYLNRRMQNILSYTGEMYLSLNELLDITLDKSFIDNLSLVTCAYSEYHYNMYNKMSISIRDYSLQKMSNGVYDIKLRLYLKYFGDDKSGLFLT